jgi:hypothetical protein
MLLGRGAEQSSQLLHCIDARSTARAEDEVDAGEVSMKTKEAKNGSLNEAAKTKSREDWLHVNGMRGDGMSRIGIAGGG